MSVELSLVFERAHGERLADAERLLRWMAQTFARALAGLDIAYDGPRRTVLAVLRFQPDRFGSADGQRIRFWVARAGGRARAAVEVPPPEWAALRRAISRCDVRAVGVEPSAATRSIAAVATAAGLADDRRGFADDRPTLALDIGGPGWDAVRWDEDSAALFIASPIAPPLGDPVPVLFRVRGLARVAVEWTRVVKVRAPADAGPGEPAGFTLGLAAAPRELRMQIARTAAGGHYGSRAAPRFQCTRPLEATFSVGVGGRGVAGLVENLSLGGAFVRTSAPAPVGAELELSCLLPNRARMETKGVVAFAGPRGMGIRFVPDARSAADVQEALTVLAARPRRALVVEDDALVRRLIADALAERGFDVVTAADALEGLRTLSEEILSLDLLVTDQELPGRSGEELVSTLRQTGGEADLVVAVVTGSRDAALEARLLRAGANLVLGKELGPERIAERLDALLEERVEASAAPQPAQGPGRGGGAPAP